MQVLQSADFKRLFSLLYGLQEKVKKVLDIWSKTSTFSPEALKSAYGKLSGETDTSSKSSKTAVDNLR